MKKVQNLNEEEFGYSVDLIRSNQKKETVQFIYGLLK